MLAKPQMLYRRHHSQLQREAASHCKGEDDLLGRISIFSVETQSTVSQHGHASAGHKGKQQGPSHGPGASYSYGPVYTPRNPEEGSLCDDTAGELTYFDVILAEGQMTPGGQCDIVTTIVTDSMRIRTVTVNVPIFHHEPPRFSPPTVPSYPYPIVPTDEMRSNGATNLPTSSTGNENAHKPSDGSYPPTEHIQKTSGSKGPSSEGRKSDENSESKE